MIAALFVLANGPYSERKGIDVWHKERDARTYPGPHSVIAHPPCETWGKFAKRYGRIGEDDGCFVSALASVRVFGGVLEHPEGSAAFKKFNLPLPKLSGGWSEPDLFGGRSCCIFQGKYGHRAPKATWLYKVRGNFPELKWGRTPPRDLSHLAPAARKRAIRTGICQRLSRRQRMLTPKPFMELLISLVKNQTQTG